MYLEGLWSNDQLLRGVGRVRYVNGDWCARFFLLVFTPRVRVPRLSNPPPPLPRTLTHTHAVTGRYEGGIREAKRHGTGVMLYADGSVFGGKWRDDLKYDGVFIDGNNNWTCGEWDGFVALQALAKIKMSRAKCLYTGNIRQGQR
jgi:hypothetical protein